MAAFDDDFYNDEDAYKNRVLGGLNQNSGIAGPDPFASTAQNFAQAAQPPPQGRFDLEAIRGRLGFGKADLSNAQGWLDANRDIAQGVTIRGDKMYDPSGRYMADVISNYKTGGTRSQFLDGIDSNTGKVRAPKAAKGAGPAAPAVPAAAAAPAANSYLQQVRDLIMGRINEYQKPVDANDPNIKNQVDAFRREQQRAGDAQRAALAERAAATGSLMGGASSGSFDTDMQGIQEGIGENVSGYQAGLMGEEYQQRRGELGQMLQMALASGDAESARALQLQMAQMDDAVRRLQISESGRQFNADLGYRNRALSQQGRMFDDQFGRTLGRDYEDDYRWRILYGL
jgi:hypothetical protein